MEQNQFNSTFKALLGETEFTKEILGSGISQLMHVNYARKGRYFQSFTALSTGMERLGKLCLMLDYYINSGGHFPDIKYMRRTIGHDIELLLKRTTDVCNERSLSLHFGQPQWEPVHKAIVKILSAFAKGDRYSYIDTLVDGGKPSDPVATWFEKVDKPLFEQCVEEAKKREIRQKASLVAQMMESYSYVLHTDESGSSLSSLKDASWLTGMQREVAPYRQLYTLQIIRFWVDVIFELQYEAMKVEVKDGPNIPYMTELLGSFYNPDNHLRTIQNWERL